MLGIPWGDGYGADAGVLAAADVPVGGREKTNDRQTLGKLEVAGIRP